MRFASCLAAAALVSLSLPAAGQQTTEGMRAALSSRATVEVGLTRTSPQGGERGGTIRIDYGQPHARGREVVGNLIPFGRVWRTGANRATHLTTDVDLTIGGTHIPRGEYTLWTLAEESGSQLIVNRQTGQWGTEYDASHDLARIPLRVENAGEPVESFTIWLIPAGDRTPRGELRMAWGTARASVDWAVR